jgi:hypothetical protein
MDGVIKERQIFNEVRDISELDECAHIDIDAFARQLRMARFAMHRVRISQYQGLPPDQAKEEYRKAMENYDQILGLAVTDPARLVACEADMARGFWLPNDPSQGGA